MCDYNRRRFKSLVDQVNSGSYRIRGIEYTYYHITEGLVELSRELIQRIDDLEVEVKRLRG